MKEVIAFAAGEPYTDDMRTDALRLTASIRLCVAALCGCTLASCAGNAPLQSTANLQVTRDVALPTPTRTDAVVSGRISLIGPLDTLGIDVFGAPDFSRDVVVDGSGRIALPLVGTIKAGGSTAAELASEITTLLRAKYVHDPKVIVNIKVSVSQVVTLDGAIAKPGLYPVSNQSTLMRAIAAGGGLAGYAKLDDVVILRTVNNRRMAGLYNLEQIRRGAYADPAIYANDVVVVGDSAARRLFRNVLAVAPLAVAPLIAVVQ